jgi:hypothetical protein
MELLHGYYQQRSAKSLTTLFEVALQYRKEESNLVKLTRTFLLFSVLEITATVERQYGSFF